MTSILRRCKYIKEIGKAKYPGNNNPIGQVKALEFSSGDTSLAASSWKWRKNN